MMTEQLTEQIRQMKEVHRLEQLKRNRVAQERLNQQYSERLQQAHLLMATLIELRAKVSFSLKGETVESLRKAVVQLKNVVFEGAPVAERLTEAERTLKGVEGSVRTEWKRYDAAITANPIRILQIAQPLNLERCRALIQILRASAEWTTAPHAYAPLYAALDESNGIIRSMNADEEVIRFLERMNQGTATVADLSANVLNWLRERSLTGKIRLRFEGK